MKHSDKPVNKLHRDFFPEWEKQGEKLEIDYTKTIDQNIMEAAMKYAGILETDELKRTVSSKDFENGAFFVRFGYIEVFKTKHNNFKKNCLALLEAGDIDALKLKLR